MVEWLKWLDDKGTAARKAMQHLATSFNKLGIYMAMKKTAHYDVKWGESTFFK